MLREPGGESELAAEDARLSSTFSGPRLDRSHPAESLWLERGTMYSTRETGTGAPSLLPSPLRRDDFYDNATGSPKGMIRKRR